MSKRTIDADKLYEAARLALSWASPAAGALPLAAVPPSRQTVYEAFDAAFPIAERPNGVTVIYQDEEHFIPQGVFDVLKEQFREAQASSTHNLRPLPESEWPEWHDQWASLSSDKDFYRIGSFVIVRSVDDDGEAWGVTNEDNSLLHDHDDPVWHPTPAAALEAAGLPVELLEGLKRPTPAHENPRVVAAAVEMVKDIEQHKAKAAKAREEWLAQFPEWVQDWCAEDDKIVPLRCGDTWLIYADEGTKTWHIGDYFGLHYREASPGKQFVGKLASLVADLNLPLYADGNVPLWGDVTEHSHDPGRARRVTSIGKAGRLIFDDGAVSESPLGVSSYHHLLRRHPAIADLPGITVDSDKSTAVADKVGKSVGESKVKLRVGMRVEHARYGKGFVITAPYHPLGGNKWFVAFTKHADSLWINVSDLTPIPPPLIDNGDGTWTMEGYGMFVIQPKTNYPAVGAWEWMHMSDGGFPLSASKDVFYTKEAAAEDLWRRMEGVR